jgi:hypothetical protein
VRTLEFRASLNPDHTLTVPTELAAQLRPEQPVRVILLVPEVGEDQEWARLTAEQFVRGYADGDAIYDELPAG